MVLITLTKIIMQQFEQFNICQNNIRIQEFIAISDFNEMTSMLLVSYLI